MAFFSVAFIRTFYTLSFVDRIKGELPPMVKRNMESLVRSEKKQKTVVKLIVYPPFASSVAKS